MNSGRAVSRAYHHGNLRDALVAAGLELARAAGPDGVQLRAVSREAGVSHNAAYRHFASQEDLLAAVGQRCMGKLAELMRARLAAAPADGTPDTARARLGVIGHAYIDFARTEPGWFRAAFTSAQPHVESGLPEPGGPDGASPYQLLGARLDEMVEVGAMPAERRPGAEYAAWSTVHGLSSLLLDGPLRALPEAEVAQAVTVALGVVVSGLQLPP